MNRQRTALAERYRVLLGDVDGVLPLVVPSYRMLHAWHLFVVRIDPERTGIDRDPFMARMKDRGVGTGLHFRAAHQHKYYRDHYQPPAPLPNTEWNSARLCSLPLFPDMTLDDVDYVVDTIRAVLREARR